MKVWAPEQMHRFGFRHSSEYIKDREAMHGMTYDQEVNETMLQPVKILWGLAWIDRYYWPLARSINRLALQSVPFNVG